MPRKPLTDEEKYERADRIDESLRTFSKVLYGSILLGGVVYFSAKAGTKAGMIEFGEEFLKGFQEGYNLPPVA